MKISGADFLASRPEIAPGDVARLARELYGLDGVGAQEAPVEHPSHCDRIFRIRDADGTSYALKILNPSWPAEILAFQDGLLAHLEGKAQVPRLLPPIAGELSSVEPSSVELPSGDDLRTCAVRLLSWIDGIPLAEARPRGEELLADIGRLVARIDRGLLDHPPPTWNVVDEWDPQHTEATLEARLERIPDGPRRALAARYLERFRARVAPRFGELRRGVIHADANDYNLLVEPFPASTGARRAVGAIDFGDASYSAVVCDLAIAAAYAMLDAAEPLRAAASVVAGYHEILPLEELEFELLFDLLCSRLAINVAMGAEQNGVDAENPCPVASEEASWRLLKQFESVSPDWARAVFRRACGLPASPRTTPVIAALRAHAGSFAPVVDVDLAADGLVVDLSVAGSDLWLLPEQDDPHAMWRALQEMLREAGKRVAIGRYDEPRAIYTAEQFAVPGSPTRERRTVHLGIDLFLPAGTPLHAPLDGIVESFADNAYALDYGPTLLLRHELPGAADANGNRAPVVFHTLWGHLSRESLDGLAEGKPIRRGERLGWMGDVDVNGGWAPHLHLQILAELLGERGTFPGVAAPSEREAWLDLCPDPNLLLAVPEKLFPPVEPTREEIRAARAERIGFNLSVSYREPLHIVRGKGQFLYDAFGRAYLDGVNNVSHVGHCHPRVVRAAQRQMAVLNTNTRYLHKDLVGYAERLASTLPDPLQVCFFVNSGSEANDLALRLARAATGGEGIVILDGAYHGHTQVLIDVSPYKFDGPGGRGRAAHVHKVAMPDPYRGLPEDLDPRRVADACAEAERSGGRVAAFLAEAILGCGGQIVPPPGYLEAAYAHARKAGAVVIADEVQIGFGRVGTHFWGFEAVSDGRAVPDIVTLGKPIGNGHPLAAVVTTTEIARSFASGMEYFNTFGGNPVSCVVGQAVLDVLEAEDLQANAHRQGERLLAGLRDLATRHALIGDVRGMGLFLGVELIRDQETLAPAAREATYLVERAKQLGVLLSTDGPLHNVIKIKPPMVWTAADVDRTVEVVGEVLGEDGARGYLGG